MNKEDFNKRIEEQQQQLIIYEKKLKDVVRAYKSLESEKKALEVALEALGSQNSTTAAESKPQSSSESESLSQVEALKQAISTLTVENKKKELAFQADRKALIAKNEHLKAQLAKPLGKTQDDISTKKLKEKLQEFESEKEKALNDHGMVVSEMHSKISELYRKIQDRDQQVQSMEVKLREMSKLESEVIIWKKKAETTPTVQLLREELANAKASYEKELSTIIGRYTMNSNEIEEKESRIAHFEERIRELSEKVAIKEQENVELNNVIADMKTKLKGFSENRTTSKQDTILPENTQKDTYGNLIYNFKSTFYKLKTKDSNFDPYNTLGLERQIVSTIPEPEVKSTIQISQQTSIGVKTQVEEMSDDTDSTESSQKDLNYFKSLIGHLQKKLRSLEKSYDGLKVDHEQTTGSLRQRISELENLNEKTYAQLTEETKRKVTELEEEMQKQRVRMLEIIAEKDREIEITKSSLAALYTQHYVASDPIDPPQKVDRDSPQPQSLANNRRSTESIRSALTYCTEDNDPAGRRSRSPVKRSISNHFGDTRNVFYEQELTRREQEIVELRNIIRLSEMKIRDIEQAALTKDIQYLQIIEALKEEIRVLEGRLVLQNSETNIEYLRNIFIQFLHSSNPIGRKHILRAIGAVLKLTQTEMKMVDNWKY